MEFGSFMEFPPIAGGSATAAFDQALDEVVEAERVGLDAVWLAELHGAPERSVLSAPIIAAAAIAARTSVIRIGIAVQVLPLSHPLRRRLLLPLPPLRVAGPSAPKLPSG